MIKRGALLFILCLLMVGVVAAAGDVAYIYRRSSKVDENIVGVFSGLGLEVDLIDENTLYRTDFSDYKFLFVGDERFRNEERIPVDKYPTIVANYYFGHEFGLTDRDGVSKLAANKPMSVKKNGRVVQVYTQAKYDRRPVAIPYYFLDDENRVVGLHSVARTFTGDQQRRDFGDVISYVYSGTDLINGKETDKKVCFFGIVESDYWTSAARDMFEDCAEFVGITCEDDDDCPEEEEGERFCKGNDVYVDVESYECEDPDTFESRCVKDEDEELVEECEEICVDGECVDIVCMDDDDCDDEDKFTKDTCVNPATVDSYCEHTPIRCFVDAHCDDNDEFTLDRCELAGTVDSYCEHEDITCTKDEDCDDSDAYTLDECLNPGTVESECRNTEMNCLSDEDCGITGFIDDSFCQNEDVWKIYQTAVCHEPATLDSYCEISVDPRMIQDCDDENDYTIDWCVENGHAYCEHELIECLVDDDCEDDYETSELFCEGNELIEEIVFHDFSCVENFCEEEIEVEESVEVCLWGCEDESCLEEPQCVDDEDCGEVEFFVECEGNELIETTIRPVCVEGYCEEDVFEDVIWCEYGCEDEECLKPPIECYENSDCGTDRWIGYPLCAGGDSYQHFKVFTCLNPGTEEAKCVDQVDLIMKLLCGDDYCDAWGGRYCEGDDVYNSRTCYDQGCEQGMCYSESYVDIELIEECAFECVDGDCLEECYVDSDCGEPVVGAPYCADFEELSGGSSEGAYGRVVDLNSGKGIHIFDNYNSEWVVPYDGEIYVGGLREDPDSWLVIKSAERDGFVVNYDLERHEPACKKLVERGYLDSVDDCIRENRCECYDASGSGSACSAGSCFVDDWFEVKEGDVLLGGGVVGSGRHGGTEVEMRVYYKSPVASVWFDRFIPVCEDNECETEVEGVFVGDCDNDCVEGVCS